MMRQHFLLSFTENRSLFHQNLVIIGHMIIIINILYHQPLKEGSSISKVLILAASQQFLLKV